MKSAINRIKLIFLGLFVVACGAVWYYHATYVWPKQRCEAHGDWWDEKDRVCAVPMPIWTFTHRMPGEVAPEHPQGVKAAPAARSAAKPAPKPAG
jgi:hypothetical protein